MAQCPPNVNIGSKWAATDIDTTATKLCPLNFCAQCPLPAEFRVVTRYCNQSGIWEESNVTWCYRIEEHYPDCISRPCHPCPLPAFRELVRGVTISLCGISIFCLFISLLIFCSFKSLNCCRLTIHKHLCVVFMLRFCVMLLWILLWKHQILTGCGKYSKKTLEPWCKMLLFFIMYATMASINWMFIEGIYLASRISIFAFNTGTPIAGFCFIGWGIPLFWVMAWALLMEQSTDGRQCWLPYSNSNHKWLLIIPMLVTLIVNFLLLVVIVAILIKKLTAANVEEPKKLWKATKATLILVPLLGVANLLWFVEPQRKESSFYQAYILFNTVVQHSQFVWGLINITEMRLFVEIPQFALYEKFMNDPSVRTGIFIATIYCFLNGEVRETLSKCRLTFGGRDGWMRGHQMPYEDIDTNDAQMSKSQKSTQVLFSETEF